MEKEGTELMAELANEDNASRTNAVTSDTRTDAATAEVHSKAVTAAQGDSGSDSLTATSGKDCPSSLISIKAPFFSSPPKS